MLALFSVFVREKVTFNENVGTTANHLEPGLMGHKAGRLLLMGHKTENYHDVTIYRYEVVVSVFDNDEFLLSSLVTGSNFMSNHYWFWSYDNFGL